MTDLVSQQSSSGGELLTEFANFDDRADSLDESGSDSIRNVQNL